MEEVNKSQLAKKINKSGAIVTRLISSGILDNCFTANGKKLFLDKSIKAIIKAKGSDYLSINTVVETSTPDTIKQDTNIYTDEAKQELEEFLSKELSPSRKVDMIDKFWSGRIRRQKFLEADGELISVPNAKAAIETILAPFNQYLDDMGNNLKNHFPDVPLEVIEWINEENNRQKEQLQVKEWD